MRLRTVPRVESKREKQQKPGRCALDTSAEQRAWFDTKPYISIFKKKVESLELKMILGASRQLRSIARNVFIEVSAREHQLIDEEIGSNGDSDSLGCRLQTARLWEVLWTEDSTDLAPGSFLAQK